MRKTYDVNADGQIYQLRLTLGGQKKLKAMHGTETMDLIFSAIGEPEKLADVLSVALGWDGNPNPKDMTGEKLYDTLVDIGYCGQLDWARLIFGLANASGLLTDAQLEKVMDRAKAAVDGIFEDNDSAANPTTAAAEPH